MMYLQVTLLSILASHGDLGAVLDDGPLAWAGSILSILGFSGIGYWEWRRRKQGRPLTPLTSTLAIGLIVGICLILFGLASRWIWHDVTIVGLGAVPGVAAAAGFTMLITGAAYVSTRNARQ